MIDLYVTLIIAKRRSFNSVPANIRNDVRKALQKAGYDTNGDLLRK